VIPNFMRAKGWPLGDEFLGSRDQRLEGDWTLLRPYSVGQRFVLQTSERRGAFSDLPFNLMCGYTNGASTLAARIFDGQLRNVIAISCHALTW
jgi:hypothetical protein